MKTLTRLLFLLVTCLVYNPIAGQELVLDSIVLSAYGINGVSSLETDRNGVLYLNDPDGGLYRYTGSGFEAVRYRRMGVNQDVKYLQQFFRDDNGAFFALNAKRRLFTFFENGPVRKVSGLDSMEFHKIGKDILGRKWFFGDRTWVMDHDELREVPALSLNGLEIISSFLEDSTLTVLCENSFILLNLIREVAVPVPLNEGLKASCGSFLRISGDSLLLVSPIRPGTYSTLGLLNTRNGTFEALEADEDLAWYSVFQVRDDGSFLFSSDSGLFRARLAYGIETNQLAAELPPVHLLLTDAYNTIWATNGSALYKLSPRLFTSAALPEEAYHLPDFFQATGILDQHGAFWLPGRNRRITFFDPFNGKKMSRRFPDGYPYKSKPFHGQNSYIVNYSFAGDGDTTLWYEEPPAIRDLAMAGQGQIYITGWKTLYYFNPEDDYFIDVFTAGDEEDLVRVLPLALDSILLFTTERILMLDRFDNVVWENKDFGELFRGEPFLKMKNENEIASWTYSGNRLYIRMLNGIVSLKLSDGTTAKVFANAAKTADEEHYRGNLDRDSSGSLWFCYRDTLFSLVDDKIDMQIPLLLPREGKSAFYQEALFSDGQIWVNTNRNLQLADPETGEIHVVQNDFLTDIFRLVEGPGSVLWRVNTRTVQLINKKEETLVSFPIRSGVNHRSILVSRIGPHIIASNGDEVVRFDERNFLESPETAAAIVRLAVNMEALCLEESMVGDSLLVLDENTERVSFKLASGDPGMASSASFMYRMVNFDNDWMYTGRSGELSYTSLPAGSYVFQYATRNRDGKWGPVSQLKIKIPPPWWETKIAFTGYIVVLLTLITLYIRLRERKLREDKSRLEIAVRERTLEIEKQKEEIEEQRDLISAQKKNLTDSINYASRIQTALIPEREAIRSLIPEHFIFYRPRDIVSGDFYWADRKGDTVIFVGADCTGHGVPGSLISMLGMTFLEDIVKSEGLVSPARILERLRERMILALKQSGKSIEMKDGMDMVVLAFPDGGKKVLFAGAKNPLYLVRNRQLEEIKGDAFPVGFSERMEDFKEHELEVNQGDLIYFFSDGFADQFGGPEEKKFKYSRFRELLLSMDDKTMSEQKILVEEAFDSWKGDIEQIDDVMVIGVRI